MTTKLNNNVAIQLTWSPSKPKLGEETHFMITFINEKTNKNQEHIDYQFIIYDQNSKGLHSGWGVEQARTSLQHQEIIQQKLQPCKEESSSPPPSLLLLFNL
jgi:hypothetical protein